MTAVVQRGKGSPPLERIVEAALQLIDAEGLEALTTVRLAQELGIFQSVIYRRVSSRDALLGLVVEAVMSEVRQPAADHDDWRAYLRECGQELHRVWLSHPHATPLLRHGGAHDAIVGLLDGVFDVLLRVAQGPRLWAASQAYLGYVFGTIAATTAAGPDLPADELDGEQARRAPALARAQLMFLHGTRPDPEQLFLAGLDVVLDGLATLFGAP